MKLANFLNALFYEGKVIATGDLTPFDTDDCAAAVEVLDAFYTRDLAEMPAQPPELDRKIALDAAMYLYRAVQLIIDRRLDATAVEQQLPRFDAPDSPEAVYSADLSLRYLPELFDLAKGMAPLDILVEKLRETATRWPFSSVGIDLPEPYSLETILEHPALNLAYTDRIIAKKDRARAGHPQVQEQVSAALGNFTALFWPELENLYKVKM